MCCLSEEKKPQVTRQKKKSSSSPIEAFALDKVVQSLVVARAQHTGSKSLGAVFCGQQKLDAHKVEVEVDVEEEKVEKEQEKKQRVRRANTHT